MKPVSVIYLRIQVKNLNMMLQSVLSEIMQSLDALYHIKWMRDDLMVVSNCSLTGCSM